jgi:hypothetical protein
MPQPAVEVPMLREQMINFLQATVIFLLITNAFTITAAVCAIRLLTGAPLEKRRASGVIGRAFLGPLPHGARNIRAARASPNEVASRLSAYAASIASIISR